MFEVVKEVMLKKKKEEIETVLETDEGRQRIFRALMGDSEEVVEGRTLLRRAALVFCRNAMKRRNKIVQIKLDQRTSAACVVVDTECVFEVFAFLLLLFKVLCGP